MSPPEKWKLIKTEDASPSHYFPIEKRSYELPNGITVEDFYVTTIADSVMVIALTTERKVVLIRMFKPGIDEVVVQFPAGRLETKHRDIKHAAVAELQEETGIQISADDLTFVYKQAVMSTKSSEHIHVYLVTNVHINSKQKLDELEEIEVLECTPQEVDQLIESQQMKEGLMIGAWYLVNKKYPELFER